jgi:hypothetical protein
MILPRSMGSKLLLPRVERCTYYRYSGDVYCYYSPWDTWGRWVVLAGIIGLFLLFFLISCLSARRRRKAGLNPYRGTGWLAGKPPPGHGPAVWTGGQQGAYQQPASNPAPPYSQQPNDSYQTTGHTGSNTGYYAPQNGGFELQSPPNTYQPQQGGEPVYAPPPGPPPGHFK